MTQTRVERAEYVCIIIAHCARCVITAMRRCQVVGKSMLHPLRRSLPLVRKAKLREKLARVLYAQGEKSN